MSRNRTQSFSIAFILAAAAIGVRQTAAQVNSAVKATARQAKRPAAIRIQASVELASKTNLQFRQPPELSFLDFNELLLDVGTFECGHSTETGAPSAFELLCYNGQSVGPTIRVHRGTTFHIRLRNNLPKNGPAKLHSRDSSSEQPHDLCKTNLHTHGLHVSPTANSDNIFTDVGPQQEVTFEYSVPADHPSGTFWYHPHRHGSVAYQLSNGLAGALIVDGREDDGIPDLEDVPEIAAAKERILVLQLYNYRVDPPGRKGVARIDATTIYDVAPDARACYGVTIPDSVPQERAQATAINGVIVPIIMIAPGEVQRWRLIHAAWDVSRRLFLAESDGTPANDMSFFEIALDGLATGTMVKKSNAIEGGDVKPTVELAPGQRSDVLLQAPLLKAEEHERHYFLRQSGQEQDANTGPASENLVLAKIVVRGMPLEMRLPDPRSLVSCQPFASIRDEELTNSSEIATTGLKFVATPHAQNKRFWINGKTFTQYTAPIRIKLGTAEQWAISAQADNHPFHIRVNPFQVVMRTDANGKSFPMNEWRDTLFIKQGDTYTIRSRFRDFLGKTVLHCHFLDHEDQGMMMPIELVPPYSAAGDQAQVANLGRVSVVAPELRLADPTGKWHLLRDCRPNNTVLIFITGFECSHCLQQLRTIFSEAGKSIDVCTEFRVVSSQPIENIDEMATGLGVPRRLKLRWLIDDACRAFRQFGCYNDEPLHGLFVIDGGGVIRARYIGDSPFTDVAALASLLNSISVQKESP